MPNKRGAVVPGFGNYDERGLLGLNGCCSRARQALSHHSSSVQAQGQMRQTAHRITCTPLRLTDKLDALHLRHQDAEHRGDFLPCQMLAYTDVNTTAKRHMGS